MIGRRGSYVRVSFVGAGTDRRAREEHGPGTEELRDRRSKILWSAPVLGNAAWARDGRVRTGQERSARSGKGPMASCWCPFGGSGPAGISYGRAHARPAATPVPFGGTDRRTTQIGSTGGRAGKNRSGPVFGGRQGSTVFCCRSLVLSWCWSLRAESPSRMLGSRALVAADPAADSADSAAEAAGAKAPAGPGRLTLFSTPSAADRPAGRH
jgi:hypothetical protein